MNNALFLANWTVGNPTIIDKVLHVPAKYDLQPDSCPRCGVVDRLYKHGAKEFTFRDAPVHGRQAVVDVTRQRYRCRECNETFWQPIPDIDDNRRMMRRCLAYIEDHALSRPNTHVAADVGVDEKIVRLIGGEYARHLQVHHAATITAPRILGIDELKLAGAMRAIFMNIETGRPIELLHTHHVPQVTQFLHWLPGKENVEVVTIDMWKGYKLAAERTMPQAKIVVDKWHVQRLVNMCLDAARWKFQRSQSKPIRIGMKRSKHLLQRPLHTLNPMQLMDLDMWLKNSPELAGAYDKKEWFMSIWSLTDKAEAREELIRWRSSFYRGGELTPFFRKAVTAVTNWEEEILNYFEHRYTNAAT